MNTLYKYQVNYNISKEIQLCIILWYNLQRLHRSWKPTNHAADDCNVLEGKQIAWELAMQLGTRPLRALYVNVNSEAVFSSQFWLIAELQSFE